MLTVLRVKYPRTKILGHFFLLYIDQGVGVRPAGTISIALITLMEICFIQILKRTVILNKVLTAGMSHQQTMYIHN